MEVLRDLKAKSGVPGTALNSSSQVQNLKYKTNIHKINTNTQNYTKIYKKTRTISTQELKNILMPLKKIAI